MRLTSNEKILWSIIALLLEELSIQSIPKGDIMILLSVFGLILTGGIIGVVITADKKKELKQ